MGNSPNWKQIRVRTISRRDEQLDRYIKIFSGILQREKITKERIQELTRKDLVGLVAQLNNQTVTSEQLVAIYGERAATYGRKTCIITEDYFQFALKKAKECDQERLASKKHNWTFDDEWNMDKFFPPLFGIPISVKDNIDMQGTRSTIGATIRAQRFIKQDCATVKCFKYSGMIPFMKSNLPQLAFTDDSVNHLWGRTLNPWNHKKSAGGSSGGQGAAIAARVSPVGIGNDMGGSIRIPSSYNGVFGICPSADRLPFNGQITHYTTGFRGLDTLMNCNGPISTSVDSLALWLRNMTQQDFYQGEHDAYRKKIPFDVATFKQYSSSQKKLRIGYIESFKLIEPTPAVKRAVDETIQFLKKDGHQVVQLSIPNQTELILSYFTQLLSEGGFVSFKQILQGQQMIDQYKQLAMMSDMNGCLYTLLKCWIDKKYPRQGLVMGASKSRCTHDYIVHAGRVHQMKHQWIKYWREQKIDLMVSPSMVSQAGNHGSSKQGALLASYIFIHNLLRMTACSQPITVTREDERHYQSRWQDPVTQLIRNNLKDAQGMPVSIQVVGLPFEQEKVLGFSKRIEKHFKFYEKHPLPDVK